jgi:hypothetical protein
MVAGMTRLWVYLGVGYHMAILGLRAGIVLTADGYHVEPGDRIQDAIEQAATNSSLKTVWVHAGEYRPDARRQALVWFNKKHDGVQLRAVGSVTLTAANPGLGLPSDKGYPAAVNHVVYFGDGIYLEHAAPVGFGSRARTVF